MTIPLQFVAMEDPKDLDTPGKRLAWAREKAGFKTPRSAAIAHGWPESTYNSHEKGTRAGELSKDLAEKYGRAFRRKAIWLLTGYGSSERTTVPIVGLAGAGPGGSIVFGEGDGGLGEAQMPADGSDETVAVEARGDSQRGIAENGWLVYYNNRHDPPNDSLVGKLCVVGLADGHVLIKTLRRGRKKRHFDLESASAPLIQDALVEWAARVTWIKPT